MASSTLSTHAEVTVIGAAPSRVASAARLTADTSEHHRRTIYLIAKRNLRLPLMEAFDAPDLLNSCARREQSTHALQSLELLNGSFSNDQARVFAGRLLKEKGWNPNALVQRAFRLATGREPTAQETQIAARFLSEQSVLLRQRLERKEEVPVPAWMPETLDKASGAALCDFSLAMFGLPGFLYLN
jgi:multidrug efflux pump subunit AcrA (membrane-fusion protein)